MTEYSAHGWHWIGSEEGKRFRVYHQGGLDCFCGFYAAANLVNFLKFKLRKEEEDFIGSNDFAGLTSVLFSRRVDELFPKTPLGDVGFDSDSLEKLLKHMLETVEIPAVVKIEEENEIPVHDPSQDTEGAGFRIGVRKAFESKNKALLGLAAIMEDKDDRLQHWVAIVGKGHLGDTIECEDDGIVLDSDRGYLYWKLEKFKGKPYIRITRDKDCPDHLRDSSSDSWRDEAWVSSFISVELIPEANAVKSLRKRRGR